MPVKPSSGVSVVGSSVLMSTGVVVQRARSEVGVRDTGSAQTGVLQGPDEKLCGWPEDTETGVSHQDGGLKNNRESVVCHSDLTSRGSSGCSLGFDVDMAVDVFCDVDDDPSTVSEGLDGDDGFVTDVELECLVEAQSDAPPGVIGISCLSAHDQFGLSGRISSAGQRDIEVTWALVLHSVDGQFSDAEDESWGENIVKCHVGESGLFQVGFDACTEVCDEGCVGIPCKSESMQA
ncbi:uncharacterized protein LOC130050025 [Ostrea edulis]|uniref:uncharacterized protein LOC130050025 n=1 Tax=Ostrea edulis TaxID=37623 RepID=UPI0024AFD055|nr:uncharacterized protein LOC130050025 [Ostrea edulis]